MDTKAFNSRFNELMQKEAGLANTTKGVTSFLDRTRKGGLKGFLFGNKADVPVDLKKTYVGGIKGALGLGAIATSVGGATLINKGGDTL